MRSLDAAWNYERWEKLPDDGNRYEVIDGVLYMTTAPSNFHQWIIQQLIRYVGIPATDTGLAFFAFAPIISTFRSQPRVKIAPAAPRSRQVTYAS